MDNWLILMPVFGVTSAAAMLAQAVVMPEAVGYVNLIERFGSFGLWAVVVIAWIFKIYPAQRKAEEDRETARAKTAEDHVRQIKELVDSKDLLALSITEKLTASNDRTIANFTTQIDRIAASFALNLDKERELTNKIADLFQDRLIEKLEALGKDRCDGT